MIRTTETLSKDQSELLHLCKQFNYVISILDSQLLAAAGHFLKRLLKCTYPVYTSYYYRLAQQKVYRSKGKHNKIILDKIRTLSGQIACANKITSSVPGLI